MSEVSAASLLSLFRILGLLSVAVATVAIVNQAVVPQAAPVQTVPLVPPNTSTMVTSAASSMGTTVQVIQVGSLTTTMQVGGNLNPICGGLYVCVVSGTIYMGASVSFACTSPQPFLGGPPAWCWATAYTIVNPNCQVTPSATTCTSNTSIGPPVPGMGLLDVPIGPSSLGLSTGALLLVGVVMLMIGHLAVTKRRTGR